MFALRGFSKVVKAPIAKYEANQEKYNELLLKRALMQLKRKSIGTFEYRGCSRVLTYDFEEGIVKVAINITYVSNEGGL